MTDLERFKALEDRIALLEREAVIHKFTWNTPDVPPGFTKPDIHSWMAGSGRQAYIGLGGGHISRDYTTTEILLALLNSGLIKIEETPAVPAKMKVILGSGDAP